MDLCMFSSIVIHPLYVLIYSNTDFSLKRKEKEYDGTRGLIKVNDIFCMDIFSFKNRKKKYPENIWMLLILDSSSLEILDANTVYQKLLEEKECKGENRPFVLSSKVKKNLFSCFKCYWKIYKEDQGNNYINLYAWHLISFHFRWDYFPMMNAQSNFLGGSWLVLRKQYQVRNLWIPQDLEMRSSVLCSTVCISISIKSLSQQKLISLY